MPKTKTLHQEIVLALKTAGVATKDDLKNHLTKKDLEDYPTKDDITKAFKNYPTKDETKKMVTDIVKEASDTILSGMEEMFKSVPTKTEFKNLETKVDALSTDVHFIKDDIKNIEAQISTLPTRQEFDKLKSQVNKSYV